MPQLVFWNLAAGNEVKVSPVTVRDDGTVLVSGYDQALLKAFLAGGRFNEGLQEEFSAANGEEEELLEVKVNEKGDVEMEVGDDEAWVKKMLRDKADSLALMDRVLGHRSLAMLEVLD